MRPQNHGKNAIDKRGSKIRVPSYELAEKNVTKASYWPRHLKEDTCGCKETHKEGNFCTKSFAKMRHTYSDTRIASLAIRMSEYLCLFSKGFSAKILFLVCFLASTCVLLEVSWPMRGLGDVLLCQLITWYSNLKATMSIAFYPMILGWVIVENNDE
ncbi:hypothetical protein Tco_1547902 [Tanacetum coccineum]